MSEHYHIIAQRLVDTGKSGGDITIVSQELLEAARELKWAPVSQGRLASTDEANWALNCAQGLIEFWSLTNKQRHELGEQRVQSDYRKQQTVPEYRFD